MKPTFLKYFQAETNNLINPAPENEKNVVEESWHI
jgi:hypothetical protein